MPIAKTILPTYDGWLYNARLDRRFVIQGVAVGGALTRWTLPINDPTLNTLILGPDFTDAGRAFPIIAETGTDPTSYAYGDIHTSGPCILGRSYLMDLVLSQQFARDRNGNAMSGGTLSMRRMVTMHTQSGQYTVEVKHSPEAIRATRETEFSKLDGSGLGTIVEDHGRHIAFIQGDSEHVLVSISSSAPRPCHINSVTFEGDYSSVGDLAQVS